jgi:hypothetical protein
MRADNVLTLDSMPTDLMYPVLVVHASEKKKYRNANKGVKVIATKAKGIGKTRAFICRYALKHGHDVVGMLDDDINGWLWKEKFNAMGTIREATTEERDKRWRIQIKRAQILAEADQGYAVSFTYRFALAAPNKEYTTGIKLRIGLVNECMLMNKQAMQNAEFTLETCEDIESTLHWLSNGIIAGQDQRLGHTSPKTALSADRGGCGEYREQHDGFHLRNHRRLWKLFPEFVAKPVDQGKRRGDGMVMLKTRVGYSKAAKAGGII